MMTPERSMLNPKIEVRASPIHGKGCFALEGIVSAETIVVWGGCYTDKAGAEKAVEEGCGIMQWDDDIFSYGSGELEDVFKINHSCDPNTWMSDAYTLVARREIPAGEEVTVDMAVLGITDEPSSMECRCGSPICRGKVSGDDWMDPVVQERYAGHFCPLINKMILRMKGGTSGDRNDA